jgi:ribosomal protein S17
MKRTKNDLNNIFKTQLAIANNDKATLKIQAEKERKANRKRYIKQKAKKIHTEKIKINQGDIVC